MTEYYPPASFSFGMRLAASTEAPGGFSEVSGLDADSDVVALKEGGDSRFVHKLPSRAKRGPLVCKRGLLPASGPLFEWVKSTLESDLSQPIQPQDLVVDLLDQNQTAIMRWSLARAWPVKWSTASLSSDQNDVAIETLEFAYQSIQREPL